MVGLMWPVGWTPMMLHHTGCIIPQSFLISHISHSELITLLHNINGMLVHEKKNSTN
jgi:hypothetical protein